MSKVEDHPVSRNPSDYTPSTHFATRVKDLGNDPNRHLSGDIINGCIKTGTPRKDKKHVWFLRETFDAVTYRLVVNTKRMEVITGYPIGIDPERAIASGRWTPEQARDIREHISKADRRNR